MSRLRTAAAALLLAATSVVGGPGLSLLEAYVHASRQTPGHGPREHFEARDGQDHSDRCGVGLASAPARTAVDASSELRVLEPARSGSRPPEAVRSARPAASLPLSRAPPLPG